MWGPNPPPGIEPRPLAVETRGWAPGPPGKSQDLTSEPYKFQVWERAAGCGEVSHWSLHCGWCGGKSQRMVCGNAGDRAGGQEGVRGLALPLPRNGAAQGTWEGREKDGHPQDAWGSANSQRCSLQRPPLRFQIFQSGGLSFGVFFWPFCVACRVLVPWPGIKPMPPAVKSQSQPLNYQGSYQALFFNQFSSLFLDLKN